ncbi:MAG: class I SAM-dependent methyltransferase, partial [Myxococcota bacterium]
NGFVMGPNGLQVPAAQRNWFRAPQANGVYLTSRSAMLNQELTSMNLEQTGDTRFWNSGSYMEQLNITSADLNQWAQAGVNRPPARVLDVASGGSLFPEEVRAINGLPVDVVDINHALYVQNLNVQDPGLAQRVGLQANQPNQPPTRRDAMAHVYAQNMDRLAQIDQANQGNVIPTADRALFNQLHAARHQIAAWAHDGQTIQRNHGDATQLNRIGNDQYGVYLNSWMMNYLPPDQRISAIREAIRVVAPGGEIRIQGGTLSAEGSTQGPLLPANMVPPPRVPRAINPLRRNNRPQVAQEQRNMAASGPAEFRRWFAGQLQADGVTYHISNSRVQIDNQRSTNTLLVLRVLPNPPAPGPINVGNPPA